MIESAIWWTGASVLCAGAALGAVFVLVAIVAFATLLANHYGRRAYNIQNNLRYVAQWHMSGCPKWRFKDGEVTRMHPTTFVADADD